MSFQLFLGYWDCHVKQLISRHLMFPMPGTPLTGWPLQVHILWPPHMTSVLQHITGCQRCSIFHWRRWDWSLWWQNWHRERGDGPETDRIQSGLCRHLDRYHHLQKHHHHHYYHHHHHNHHHRNNRMALQPGGLPLMESNLDWLSSWNYDYIYVWWSIDD